MRPSKAIRPAVFVRLNCVGKDKAVAFMNEISKRNLHAIKFIACGGPDGTYIAVHYHKDLVELRKVWREINKV